MRWIKFSISAEGRWLGRQVRFLLRPLIANVVCIVIGSVLTLADPLIVKWLIDTAIPQRSLRLILVGRRSVLCHVSREPGDKLSCGFRWRSGYAKAGVPYPYVAPATHPHSPRQL